MVELDEDAAALIQNLLHTDLSTRQKGLKQLRLVTADSWDIKYREYLWKAIEEEKSKSLQQELVKFAVQKMGEDSLRKMIRIIENNDLHAGSTSYVAKKYLDLEIPIVREALIKSLQRDTHHIVQFVLRLLNDADFYRNYQIQKYQSFIQDIMQEDIPLESRKEFLIRLMNRYFQGYDRLLIRAKIWDIIQEDLDLHKLLFDAFYYDQPKEKGRFVTPSFFPRLLPFRKFRQFNYTRDNRIYSWIEESREIEFLYSTASTEHKSLRERYIEIIASINIPPYQSDQIVDGDLSNIYATWNQITSNHADPFVTDVEEFDREYFLPLFPQLLEQPDLEPTDILQGMNPHALFYHILRYLPRYLLIEQVRSNPFNSCRTTSLESLSDRKYWTEASNTSLLKFSIVGPQAIWKHLFTYLFEITKNETSRNLRVAATEVFYYLNDILTDAPELTEFWNGIYERFTTIQNPLLEFNQIDPDTILEELETNLAADISAIRGIDGDDQIYQKHLGDLVTLAERYITQLQSLTNNILDAQEILNTIDRDMIKLSKDIGSLKSLNLWFDLIIEHFNEHISPIQASSRQGNLQFQRYSKHIGQLSEHLREIIQLVGDPKEFTTKDPAHQSIIDNITTTGNKLTRKLVNLPFTPYSYFERDVSSSLTKIFEKQFIKMKGSFEVLDETTIRSELVQYLNELKAEETDHPVIRYRIKDLEGYPEIDLDNYNIFDGESFQLLGYLILKEDITDNIEVIQQLFATLSETYQLQLLGVSANAFNFNLTQSSGDITADRATMAGIFKSSQFVKVRTKSALLFK